MTTHEKMLELLAETVEHILGAKQRASGQVTDAYADVLNLLCRKLENIAPRNVSRAAQQLADQRKLGDLRRYKWSDQTKRSAMNDAGRRIFHWDHFVPVGETVRSLERLVQPTRENIIPLLREAKIVWITKVENQRLDRKYKSHRPDPEAAYGDKDVSIDLHHSWSECARPPLLAEPQTKNGHEDDSHTAG